MAGVEKEAIGMDKYYKNIPEEFYSSTHLPVVTPDNFEAYLKLVSSFIFKNAVQVRADCL